MKHLLLLLTLTTMISVPAQAQDKAVPAGEPVTKERLALAEDMHDIWPIRLRMEEALDSVAQNFPQERQQEIQAIMRKSIQYDRLEEESIKAMATIFTEDELKAMIAFYGSDAGRAVSAKTGLYEDAMTPVISQMMDKALLDLKLGTQNQ